MKIALNEYKFKIMEINNVKMNMNWMRALYSAFSLGVFFVSSVLVRIFMPRMMLSSTISYMTAQNFRAGSILNFLQLFIFKNKFYR